MQTVWNIRTNVKNEITLSRKNNPKTFIWQTLAILGQFWLNILILFDLLLCKQIYKLLYPTNQWYVWTGFSYKNSHTAEYSDATCTNASKNVVTHTSLKICQNHIISSPRTPVIQSFQYLLLFHLRSCGPSITLLMKFTIATAGCSGSISANRWHTFSVALPVRLATKPNILQQKRHDIGQNTWHWKTPGFEQEVGVRNLIVINRHAVQCTSL